MDEVRSSEGNLLLANYDYTPLSRRSLDTLGDGGTVSYGYTLAGDLTSLAQVWSGGGVSFAHTYHPDHRLATSTPSNATFLWQPLAGGTDAFAAANGLNQYASMTPAGQGARTLTYDSLQNLTSDGVNTFGFDLENRMLSASKAGMSAVYTYDPLGRRVAKSVNGVATATLFDGDSEIGDIEGGVYVRRYVPGPGIDAPVAIREGAGWVWPRRDRLGSVIARTNASGIEGSAITYDPYGTSAQASAASGGFLFTGRRHDAETGLYYIRARMYSPALGRFLQTDPVGYADQMNLYAYVGNDPGNATDPSGECPVCIGAGVGALVNGGLYAYNSHKKGNFTWAGLGANVAEGAVVGGVLGSGAGLLSAVTTAAGANIVESAITSSAAGEAIDRYTGGALGLGGWVNSAKRVATDAIVGGAEGALGKAAGFLVREISIATSAAKGFSQNASYGAANAFNRAERAYNTSRSAGAVAAPTVDGLAEEAVTQATKSIVSDGPLRVEIYYKCTEDGCKIVE